MFDQERHFYVQGNQDFNDRQKSVFLALDKLSTEQPKNRYESEELKTNSVSLVKDRKELKQFLGQESIFKRPEVKPRKYMKLRIPEFIKNPHKWKKYSLGDDEISDQSNRIVAMSFLKALRDRSSTEISETKSNSKPKFNKHLKDTGTNLASVSQQNESPTFINGKTIMPEYVVGQKIRKENKRKEHPITAITSVKLEHLFNDE